MNNDRQQEAMAAFPHTGEPWEVREDGKVYHRDGYLIARFEDWPDAFRAKACVNACKGIPTEALEAGVVEYLVSFFGQLADNPPPSLGNCDCERVGGAVVAQCGFCRTADLVDRIRRTTRSEEAGER